MKVEIIDSSIFSDVTKEAVSFFGGESSYGKDCVMRAKSLFASVFIVVNYFFQAFFKSSEAAFWEWEDFTGSGIADFDIFSGNFACDRSFFVDIFRRACLSMSF